MKVNYHTHCRYCDGKGDPRDYVLEAIKRGFTSIGFSSHAPLIEESDWTMSEDIISDYINEISLLKSEFKDKIVVYCGMEIDYFSDENRFKHFDKFKLDYSIGAVHVLRYDNKYYDVDASPKDYEYLINEVFGSSEAFVRAYYTALRGLISQGGFDILAHFDLVRKYNKDNKFFTEKEAWYIDEVNKTLSLLEGKDIIVEVNTGAIARGVQNTPYPSKWILDECFRRGIKVCLNSDCHSADKIDCYYDEAMGMIKDTGYRELNTPFETILI